MGALRFKTALLLSRTPRSRATLRPQLELSLPTTLFYQWMTAPSPTTMAFSQAPSRCWETTACCMSTAPYFTTTQVGLAVQHAKGQICPPHHHFRTSTHAPFVFQAGPTKSLYLAPALAFCFLFQYLQPCIWAGPCLFQEGLLGLSTPLQPFALVGVS